MRVTNHIVLRYATGAWLEGAQCKYFDICHSSATWVEGNEPFCILHAPTIGKAIPAVLTALTKYRAQVGVTFGTW